MDRVTHVNVSTKIVSVFAVSSFLNKKRNNVSQLFLLVSFSKEKNSIMSSPSSSFSQNTFFFIENFVFTHKMNSRTTVSHKFSQEKQGENASDQPSPSWPPTRRSRTEAANARAALHARVAAQRILHAYSAFFREDRRL